jgi:hypothetical protein
LQKLDEQQHRTKHLHHHVDIILIGSHSFLHHNESRRSVLHFCLLCLISQLRIDAKRLKIKYFMLFTTLVSQKKNQNVYTGQIELNKILVLYPYLLIIFQVFIFSLICDLFFFF